MPDPTFTAQDYLQAELVVDGLLQNMAIHYHVAGEGFDRITMQQHVNKRHALILVKRLLLDEAERVGA